MNNQKTYKNAELLLQELGITDPSDIDIEAIAHYCGVKIKYRILKGCEASIIGVSDKAVVTIDSTSRYERQRFSIGHELGHWMFDRGKGSVSKRCSQKDIGSQWSTLAITSPEVRANVYAANLLMPTYLFYPLAKNYNMTFDATRELASTFQTSLTATSIRLVQSGILPAMLVCFSHNKREWFVSGPDVPDYFFPHRELDSYSEAFKILYGKNERTCKPTEVSADTWIDRRNAEEYLLYEQSVKISKKKVLSMLWWKDESQIIDEMDN